jgi:hypothetical protein
MFCSFKVRSPDVLAIPGQMNTLDTGINVFSAEVPDLDAFRGSLEALGIEVLEVHRLDDLEPVTPEMSLLPGEANMLEPKVLSQLRGVTSKDDGDKN